MHLPFHPESAFLTHELEGSSQPYLFLNSIIVPRPVALVTTLGCNGIVNAAPFSYFNAVSNLPVIISLSIAKREGERKDTARNILANRQFVINICSHNMAEAVSMTGTDFPPEISEIEMARLSLIPSQKISVPRIANSLIQMECLLHHSIEIGKGSVDLILGEVLNVHIHKNILNSQGHIEITKLNPLARLAGKSYASLHDFFETL